MGKENSKVILGMDIGGTNLRIGIIRQDFKLLKFAIEPSQEVLNGDRLLDNLQEVMESFLKEALGEYCLSAISMGFPSTIDKTRRRILSSPNIKLLQNLDVASIIEEKFNVPVYVNRDVNFLFEYDMYKSGIDTNGIILGFYIGTGFGNAVSINGKLLSGKNGVAAELGHIPVFGNKDICGCGNEGCVETIASGVYLAELCKRHFKDTPINELFTKHGDSPEITQFIESLSLPIATEVNIFDPDYIIIGGGVVSMPDFPMEALIKRVKLHTRKPFPEENLEVLLSRPHQENGVVGAGIYGFKRLLKDDYI